MQFLDGLTLVLFLLAVIVYFATAVWFYAEAFRKSVLWGLAVLFLPLASIVFLFGSWDRAGKPFLWNLASIAVVTALFFTNANFHALVCHSGAEDKIAQSQVSAAPAVQTTAPTAVKHSVAKHVLQHHSGKGHLKH